MPRYEAFLSAEGRAGRAITRVGMKTIWMLPIAFLLGACDEPAPRPAKEKPAASATTAVVPAVASGPWMDPEPSPQNKKAYFEYLQRVMPETLDQVNCACCGKSLHQCYKDMADPTAETQCPYG